MSTREKARRACSLSLPLMLVAIAGRLVRPGRGAGGRRARRRGLQPHRRGGRRSLDPRRGQRPQLLVEDASSRRPCTCARATRWCSTCAAPISFTASTCRRSRSARWTSSPATWRRCASPPIAPGVFQYYCTSMCGTCHFYMRGWIVVTAAGEEPVEPPPILCSFCLVGDEPEPPPGDLAELGVSSSTAARAARPATARRARGGVVNDNSTNGTVPEHDTTAQKLFLASPEDAEAFIDLLRVDPGSRRARGGARDQPLPGRAHPLRQRQGDRPPGSLLGQARPGGPGAAAADAGLAVPDRRAGDRRAPGLLHLALRWEDEDDPTALADGIRAALVLGLLGAARCGASGPGVAGALGPRPAVGAGVARSRIWCASSGSPIWRCGRKRATVATCRRPIASPPGPTIRRPSSTSRRDPWCRRAGRPPGGTGRN